jgi:hypothetical protein
MPDGLVSRPARSAAMDPSIQPKKSLDLLDAM